jgi:hypothetical protein
MAGGQGRIMTTDDQAYYLSRAEAELALAACAVHPAAMRAHYHLAGFYLDKAHGSRVDGPDRRAHLRLVASNSHEAA